MCYWVEGCRAHTGTIECKGLRDYLRNYGYTFSNLHITEVTNSFRLFVNLVEQFIGLLHVVYHYYKPNESAPKFSILPQNSAYLLA